jgi:hypothetical protein
VFAAYSKTHVLMVLDDRLRIRIRAINLGGDANDDEIPTEMLKHSKKIIGFFSLSSQPNQFMFVQKDGKVRLVTFEIQENKIRSQDGPERVLDLLPEVQKKRRIDNAHLTMLRLG